MFFPDRAQLSIFDIMDGKTEEKTEEEYLAEAYRLRNRDIGYRPNAEKEGGDDK